MYHRRESPTQTAEVAILQERSGEVWGKVPRNGFKPTVQAYPLALPVDKKGIEFTTSVNPYPNGTPFEVRWYLEQDGVFSRYCSNNIEHAAISAVVVNKQK